MGEEVKKISFGFSKFTKKTQIVSSTLNQIKPEKTNVELIDCFEGNSIKLKNPVQPVDNILVIPLKRHPLTKPDSDGECNSKSLTLGVSNLDNSDSWVTVEPSVKIDSVFITENGRPSENKEDLKTMSTEILSLDEIAAKEILEDLKEKKSQDESRIFSVPLTNNPPAGENESSLEDYNNIPVGDFGLAMLRGMGWAPGKGIGKNEKLVTPSLPTLRPKGMGLGADKVLKPSIDTKTSTEELKMVKNSFIRVIAGQYKDSYGQIEGFDDETGRLIVKLALKNISVSLNEFMVQLVDKVEFLKNSKVINVSKYEKYKDDESKQPEKCDHINKRMNVKQNAVNEHEIQHKGKQFGPSLSSYQSKITKYAEIDVVSPVEGPEEKEADKRKGVELPRKLHRHKHSNKQRSRSSSTSSSNEKSYKMSKDSSKRARSSSSSSSSADSYQKKKILYKNKYKHVNNDERSFHRESASKKKARSRSTSSSSSEPSDYYKKNVKRAENKKSISKRYKSKRRSKSPKERDSSKKHKNKYR